MEPGKQSRSKFRPVPRPSGVSTVSIVQHVEVVDLYHDLLHEYRELDRRATEREKRYRGLKKSLRDWDEYFKRKRQTAVAGHESNVLPVTPRLPDTSPLPDAMTTPRPRPIESATSHQPPFPSRLRNTTHAGSEPPTLGSRSDSSWTDASTVRITSSQSTEGPLSSPQLQRPYEEDDSPVVVSARSLKRKRDPAARRSVERDTNMRDGTPNRPLHVKEESHSSPIANYLVRPQFLRNETSDLDAHSASASHRTSNSENLPPNIKQESRQESVPSRNLDRVPTESTVLLNQVDASGHAIDEDMLDGEITSPATTAKQQKTTPERVLTTPLQVLSNNTPVLPRTSALNYEKTISSRKSRNSGATAVHVLSEDGNGPVRSAKKLKRPFNEDTPKAPIAHRLDNLLEGTAETPARAVISPRLKTSSRKTREQTELRPEHVINSPLTRKIRVIRDRVSPKDFQAPEDDPGPVRPEDEPLRSRPLQHLNIDDFRINPKYSGGQPGYAYNETVRKKQERRSLPGVSKDFHQLAAAGVLPNAPRQRGLFDEVSGDVDDDELTLQGYLGRGYAQIIHTASAEEKKKMLINARAQAFANQHGKNRQAFARRNTPPGFWRTDMPTTQEEEEDREKAGRMERHKVEERWREAMRGDGRYIFRDES